MSSIGRRSTPEYQNDDDRLPASRQEAIDHILRIRRWQEESGFLTSRAFQGILKTCNSDDLDCGVHHRRFTSRTTWRGGIFSSSSMRYGFKKKNVRAICSAAESSKNVLPQKAYAGERRLIGEKGLRFKSVFKVASSVWIRSGHYSFRFDRDGELGRIRPI
ncbi:uncharacterized protein QC761_0000340 [Podospora bellae-mahoneyi]|uniref:Transposase n=1 Tax=Podospora bellae-mahoneyi TaxID=2093777 RepID=A0ABR0FTV6_9PEZI|nr:hypothetical protein QC761_0000340 [Podospora bellae-mahoneyi]